MHHRTVSGGESHEGIFDVSQIIFVSWLITMDFFPQLRGYRMQIDCLSAFIYIEIYPFDFVLKCFKLNIF
jgi:hypothetical protein